MSAIKGRPMCPREALGPGRFGPALVALILLPLLAGAACRRPEPAPLGRLAFVRGDTLFLQALPDGRARAHGVGRSLASPRWSPTGAWLAFRAADGLHLTRADGAGGQKVAGPEAGAFAWAPTDDRLAYVAGGNLVVVRAGGMGVALAERTRYTEVEGVAWSADGQWLAYGVRPGTGAPPGAPRPTLWRIPARGGAGGVVPLPPVPFAGPPLVRGLTSDGSRVLALLPAVELHTGSLAAGGGPLYSLPVAGGVPERLADSVLAYPDFVSPEPLAEGRGRGGDAVAFVAGGGEATWWNKTIVVARPAGPALALSSPGRAGISPAWSPDGRHLAWTDMPQSRPAGGVDASVPLQGRRVVVADVPGGAARAWGGPPGRQEMPRWSSDGRHLLVASVDAAGTASLWVLAAGEPGRKVVERLIPPAASGGPGWNGTYGHVAWGDIVDYWPGARARPGGGGRQPD